MASQPRVAPRLVRLALSPPRAVIGLSLRDGTMMSGVSAPHTTVFCDRIRATFGRSYLCSLMKRSSRRREVDTLRNAFHRARHCATIRFVSDSLYYPSGIDWSVPNELSHDERRPSLHHSPALIAAENQEPGFY